MADDKPEPIPRKTPKKRSGPSMREQIAARRRAEAAARSEDAPVSKRPAAAPRAKAKQPKKAVVKAPARATRTAGTAGDATVGSTSRRERPTSRTGARRAGSGSSRRRAGDDEDGDGSARGRRGRTEEKKKSPIPLIATGVLVLGVGAAAYFAMTGDDVEASETDEATADVEDGTVDEGANDATGEDAGEGGEGDDVPSSPEGDDLASAGDEEDEASDPEPSRPKSGKLTDKTTEELQAMVDALEPFDRPEDVTEERWTELQSDVELMFANEGRKSNQAAKRLGEDGNKFAYPAIINRLMKIDFSNTEEVESGKVAARALTGARGSKNMRFDIGWQTPATSGTDELTERALRQDLMLIINTHRSWSKVEEDPAHWENLYLGEDYKESKEIESKANEAELEALKGVDLDKLDIDLGDG